MKHSVAVALALVLFASVPVVSHAQMKGMEMKDMEMKGKDPGKKAEGTVHKGVGVVKKVDTAKNAVTLDHEPIKSVNWSAMTMTFAVKDKKLLEKLQTGKKVEFEFVQEGKDNVITGVK